MQQKKKEEGNGSRILNLQKIVSFDNMRDTGLIEIRLKDEYTKRTTTGKKIADGEVRACVFKDKRTGIHYGIPLRELKDGSIQFKRISLRNGRIFNLEDATDREEWHVVQFWPVIEGSLMDTQGIAHFTIFDKDIEAEKYLENYKTQKQAEDYVMALSDKDLMDFALVFSIDTFNNSLAVIRRMIMEMCSQKTASGRNIVLEKIKDKEELQAVIVFRRSVASGLTKSTPTGFVYKNNTPLGIDEPSSIEFVKANPNLLLTMNNESKGAKATGTSSKVLNYENDAQKLARLKADAQQLGVEKYWLLGVTELDAAIAEKQNAATKGRAAEVVASVGKVALTEEELASRSQQSADIGKKVEPEPEEETF